MGHAMWFEGRDLAPYATPVTAGELRVGAIYFKVTFLDDDLLIPEVITLAFAGMQKRNGETVFSFQDACSYLSGARYPDTPLEGVDIHMFECAADGLNSVFEYERALETLMRCCNDKGF